MLQGGSTGRLLTYDPTTGKTRVLVKGFWYANGVALAGDESFVTVVETPSFRVYRHWLKGEKVRVECVISIFILLTEEEAR